MHGDGERQRERHATHTRMRRERAQLKRKHVGTDMANVVAASTDARSGGFSGVNITVVGQARLKEPVGRAHRIAHPVSAIEEEDP